jgi:hypothetical protein
MKHFKPALLARCRSLDNEVSDTAAKEWERAAAAYRKRLEAIRNELPAGARRLISQGALHDAKVLAISFRKKLPLLTIFVQLEGTASNTGRELALRYRVVQEPYAGLLVKKEPQIKNGTAGLGLILYDEFDLDRRHGFFTHSLLLANGDELAVRFHDLRVRPPSEVLVQPLELPSGERTWLCPSPKR